MSPVIIPQIELKNHRGVCFGHFLPPWVNVTKPFTKFTKFTKHLILGNDLSPGCHGAYNFTSVQEVLEANTVDVPQHDRDSAIERNCLF